MSAITRHDALTPLRSRKRPAVALAAVLAVTAFALTPVIFPPSADLPTPTGAQFAGFAILGAVEAIVFGAGVSFLLFGRAHVRRLFSTEARARTVHLGTTWALVSWWPHDALHMVNGVNIGGLLAIEYAFHATLIAAAAGIAWAFVTEARDRA